MLIVAICNENINGFFVHHHSLLLLDDILDEDPESLHGVPDVPVDPLEGRHQLEPGDRGDGPGRGLAEEGAEVLELLLSRGVVVWVPGNC